MKTTATKIQKTSDKVYEELKKQGFSKLFNWVDYHFFKKQTANEKESNDHATAIVNLFLYYNSETSDFADYEF